MHTPHGVTLLNQATGRLDLGDGLLALLLVLLVLGEDKVEDEREDEADAIRRLEDGEHELAARLGGDVVLRAAVAVADTVLEEAAALAQAGRAVRERLDARRDAARLVERDLVAGGV